MKAFFEFLTILWLHALYAIALNKSFQISSSDGLCPVYVRKVRRPERNAASLSASLPIIPCYTPGLRGRRVQIQICLWESTNRLYMLLQRNFCSGLTKGLCCFFFCEEIVWKIAFNELSSVCLGSDCLTKPVLISPISNFRWIRKKKKKTLGRYFFVVWGGGMHREQDRKKIMNWV